MRSQGKGDLNQIKDGNSGVARGGGSRGQAPVAMPEVQVVLPWVGLHRFSISALRARWNSLVLFQRWIQPKEGNNYIHF